eukprot:4834556-Alexandrium_andersonii.AAC.1
MLMCNDGTGGDPFTLSQGAAVTRPGVPKVAHAKVTKNGVLITLAGRLSEGRSGLHWAHSCN